MDDANSLVVDLSGEHEAVIGRVTAALKEQGFGVLTRIDMDQAFREKLGVAFRPYAILGACNPTLAFEAIRDRPDVGLFLPCNVTVDQVSPGTVRVSILDPQEMLSSPRHADDEAIRSIGAQAKDKLTAVARSLAQDSSED